MATQNKASSATTVLRTTFETDVYRIPNGDEFFEITSAGAEVPASLAENIVREAKQAGVMLHVVPPEDAPAKSEGGNA